MSLIATKQFNFEIRSEDFYFSAPSASYYSGWENLRQGGNMLPVPNGTYKGLIYYKGNLITEVTGKITLSAPTVQVVLMQNRSNRYYGFVYSTTANSGIPPVYSSLGYIYPDMSGTLTRID